MPYNPNDEEKSEDIAQKDSDADSEYDRMVHEMHQPPTSMRKNAPLKEFHSFMPKNFKQDSLYEVKKDSILIPMHRQ